MKNTEICPTKPAKVLTVTVLLSLDRESTKRDYRLVFAENATIDEEAEALKVAAMSRKKYTSIMHLGGNASVYATHVGIE